MAYSTARPAAPCEPTFDTSEFYPTPLSHRQHLEAQPGSPSLLPTSSSACPSYWTSFASSYGVSLSSVRNLSSRGRFPVVGERLPLTMTNGETHYINFCISDPNKNDLPCSACDNQRRRVFVSMLCYSGMSDVSPVYHIQLAGAMMVARTCSGSGPCLYLTTRSGIFEFQCTQWGKYDYAFWETQMRLLGVKVLIPQDLFGTDPNDLIGEGSFAEVYVATHKPTGKNVVIKRVPKKKLENLPQDHPSAVHIEIDVLRRLRHPYIVQFQAAFEDDLYYFIVLERLIGGNVLDWLRAHRHYTEQGARGMMFRVLSALVALEQEGIVHRDLKLENLVLENPDDPTSVKLIDFGLAAFLETPRMSMHCGSPGFVAPEIINKQTSYGCRADLFSAGVLLYSILSGKFPFHSEGETASRTLGRNERCQISLESARWKTISPEAKDLVLKLLTKDPSNRPSALQAMNHPWMVGGRIPIFPVPCISSGRPDRQRGRRFFAASFPQQQQQQVSLIDHQQLSPADLGYCSVDPGYCSADPSACCSACYLQSLHQPPIAYHGSLSSPFPGSNCTFSSSSPQHGWQSSPSSASNCYDHAVVARLALAGDPFGNMTKDMASVYPYTQHMKHPVILQQQQKLSTTTKTNQSCDHRNQICSRAMQELPVPESQHDGASNTSHNSSRSRSTSVRQYSSRDSSTQTDDCHWCQKLKVSQCIWHSTLFSLVEPQGQLLTTIG